MDSVSELYWEHALVARIAAPSSESGSLVVFGVGGSNGKTEILHHRHICYRYLKPKNILIDRKGIMVFTTRADTLMGVVLLWEL